VKRSLICTLILLLGSMGLSAARAADPEGQQLAHSAGQSLIGTPAPAMTLKTIDGQTIDLGKFYGHKAVYLKFWATWCVPCREQMPHFEKIYEHAGKNLAVVGVNAGFNDSIEDVRAYRKTVGLKMPIVIDDGRLADALHLRVTPQHIVIGRDGKILYIGHLVDDRLESALIAARAQTSASVAAGWSAGQQTRVLAVGSQVSGIALTDLDGRSLPLQDPAAKRATVVYFLSPWCESYLAKSRPERSASCRRAREQSEELSKNANVRWVGVASGLWSSAADLSDYRSKHQLSIPLALDETGAVFRSFSVRDVPAFVVVGPHGEITRRIDGADEALGEQLSAAAGSAL
jgi:peroxiredoxin